MSGEYKQIRHGDDAASGLQERLARQEMGDAEYDRQRSYADDRAFRLFGVAFIAVFGLVVLGVVLLGY